MAKVICIAEVITHFCYASKNKEKKLSKQLASDGYHCKKNGKTGFPDEPDPEIRIYGHGWNPCIKPNLLMSITTL